MTALAENIIVCIDEEDEDITHLLSAGRTQQALVVADYSLPQDTTSNECESYGVKLLLLPFHALT